MRVLALLCLLLCGCGVSSDDFYHHLTRPGVVERREWKITSVNRNEGVISGQANLTSAQVHELVSGLEEVRPGMYCTDGETSTRVNLSVTVVYPISGLSKPEDQIDPRVLSDQEKRPVSASYHDAGGI